VTSLELVVLEPSSLELLVLEPSSLELVVLEPSSLELLVVAVDAEPVVVVAVGAVVVEVSVSPQMPSPSGSFKLSEGHDSEPSHSPSPSGSFSMSPTHESNPSHNPSLSSSVQHAWTHASASKAPSLAAHAVPKADDAVVTVNARERTAGPHVTEQSPHAPHEPWQLIAVTTRFRK
jgi:hypothetical protein